MISKPDGALRRWLFPECFSAVLQSDVFQGISRTEPTIDCLLNSMAALLAVLRHRKFVATVGCSALSEEIASKIPKVTTVIQDRLKTWDIISSNHVGFEILVPRLLYLLADEGVSFEFPQERHLNDLYEEKMSSFQLDILYGPTQLTIMHSLEALVGLIDFNKISHHIGENGLMASPSATAAYLIYSSNWDDRAEAYLRRVLKHFGSTVGQVASAFPTTCFELSWVSCASLHSSFLNTYLSIDHHDPC